MSRDMGNPIDKRGRIFYNIGGLGFKLGFSGQGLCPWTPPKNFLKKVLWNLKNFQKVLFINIFF